MLDGYERSDDYLLLLGFKLNTYTSSNKTATQELIKLADFEDADNVITSSFDTMSQYLEGNWRDESKEYFFSMDDSLTTNYSIPNSRPEGYYDIEDGFYIVSDESGTNSKTIFKFTVVTSDIMRVHSYYNGETYTMYRQK